MIAVLVVGLGWRFWPRVDQRFVGTWSLTYVGNDTPSGVLVFSSRLGQGVGAISRNKGVSFDKLRRRSRGDTLEMHPMGVSGRGQLSWRLHWELGAVDGAINSIATFRSRDEVELFGNGLGHVVLRRLPQ
jgi:hypothetical protein